MGQAPQHCSKDLLLQGLLAQTFVVCDTHPRRSRHVIKCAGLKTWVLPDGGQSLKQAQHGKQPCLLQPRPRWRPYTTSTQALPCESCRNSPSWTTREMEEVKGWRDTRVHLPSVGIWPLVEQTLGKMLPWHRGGAPMHGKGTDFPPP